MNTESVAEKSRRAHTPRLRDQSHDSIHVRLPKEQVEALMQIAAAEFRSLPEQLAYIVSGFLAEQESR